MRNAFADEIRKIATQDSRVVMLSADIGNRLFDKFKTDCVGRFFNTGVAEANTISMAAGMAATGLRPVCYTITPFITARCYEQIKVDVCYHEQPVVIVGTGSGLSYASLGATHHSLDDLALMRVLPGMRVLAPADAMELRSCLQAAMKANHPTYLRIGKKGEPVIFAEPPPFSFGVWNRVQEGAGPTAILACGNTVPIALEAAKLLAAEKTAPEVYSCASVKPLDEVVLRSLFGQKRAVLTIEEHALAGGFGSAVAEWVGDQGYEDRAQLIRLGAGDCYLHEAGEQEYARHVYGISSARIVMALRKF